MSIRERARLLWAEWRDMPVDEKFYVASIFPIVFVVALVGVLIGWGFKKDTL